MVMDLKDVTQYSIYLHQHKDVYPECSEPYGLHGIKVAAHDKKGTMETRVFLVKHTRVEGLPRKELPCQVLANSEQLSYHGGIGECIDSEFLQLKVTLTILKMSLIDYVEGMIGCKLPWTKIKDDKIKE